jgi:NADH-quinone oxidoreductase subunit L
MWDLFKNAEALLWAVPLLPLIGFLINGLFGRRMSLASSGGVASAAVVISFICALGLFIYHMNIGEREVIQSSAFTWMNTGGFSINFGLYLDRLSSLYMLIITGVGA